MEFHSGFCNNPRRYLSFKAKLQNIRPAVRQARQDFG